ncbi:MAG: hypothetical protein MZW92_56065 [Comamonadaceae bacterium]|nr:hypothetical protein [Comamonadaceae bacterium]
MARRNATADTDRAEGAPGRAASSKKELLAHLIKQRRLAPGAGLHAHEAAAPTAWPST